MRRIGGEEEEEEEEEEDDDDDGEEKRKGGTISFLSSLIRRPKRGTSTELGDTITTATTIGTPRKNERRMSLAPFPSFLSSSLSAPSGASSSSSSSSSTASRNARRRRRGGGTGREVVESVVSLLARGLGAPSSQFLGAVFP